MQNNSPNIRSRLAFDATKVTYYVWMLFASLPPAKISMLKSGGLLRKVTLLVVVDGLAEVAEMKSFVAVSNLLLRMETSLVAVDGLEEV